MFLSLLDVDAPIPDVSAPAEPMGYAIAIIGVALCVILCGVGSAVGLYKTGSAAAGVLGEDPKKPGLTLLVLLPSTQGLYGFVIAIIAATTAVQSGMSVAAGWAAFGAVMPIALSGLVSGIFQGKSSANCIYAVGKQESLSGKLFLYPAMIEFYAILGFVISMTLIFTM